MSLGIRTLFCLTLLAPVASWAALDSSIALSLEEPVKGSDQGGTVANIRGWAVAPNGIDRVDLYVDGDFLQSVPYGGKRADVGSKYPSYKDSGFSGFSMIYNYSLFGAGNHSFKVVAYDTKGDYNEKTNTASITVLDKAFISDPALVNLTTSTPIVVDGQTLIMPNVTIDGKKYGLQANWQKPSQDIDIIYKAKAGYKATSQDGTWVGQATPANAFVTGNKACHMRTLEMNIKSGNITGESVSTEYTAFHLRGSVGSDGIIKNGTFTTLAGQSGGAYGGSLTGWLAGGTWSDGNGCAGTWWAQRE